MRKHLLITLLSLSLIACGEAEELDVTLDLDGDGVEDAQDAFFQDPNESVDTDGDGKGDNADTDDDGDGIADSSDAFPLDSAESLDTDGDGVRDEGDIAGYGQKIAKINLSDLKNLPGGGNSGASFDFKVSAEVRSQVAQKLVGNTTAMQSKIGYRVYHVTDEEGADTDTDSKVKISVKAYLRKEIKLYDGCLMKPINAT